MLIIYPFEASFPLCSYFFVILMKLHCAQCSLFKCYLVTTVRGVGLSCNGNSRTHTCVSSVQEHRNIRSIGGVSISVGHFPVEGVCM